MKKLLIFWMIAVMLLATSCNDNQPSTQQIAISKVANYAQNGNQAPTIQDYIHAGVGGVNADNIDAINAFIVGLVYEDVDTVEEIQAIINRLGLSIEENSTIGNIIDNIEENKTTDNETPTSPDTNETNTSEPLVDESKPTLEENTNETNTTEVSPDTNTTEVSPEANETNTSGSEVSTSPESNTTEVSPDTNETNTSGSEVLTSPESNTTSDYSSRCGYYATRYYSQRRKPHHHRSPYKL